MALTGQQILRDIVKFGNAEFAKSASYNLTAGKVFVAGKEKKLPCTVKPQEMFVIVSRETIEIPPGQVGYAMPKTGLCFEGILCLNTGVIDPGYKGRLSTVAINFDKEDFEIEDAREFLRIVVHQLSDPNAADPGRATTDDKYLKDRKQDTKRYPRTFLDVPGQFRRIADSVLGRQTTQMMMMLTVLAAVIGLFTVGAWLWSESRIASTVERYVSFATGSTPPGVVDKRIKALQAQVDSLRKKIN